MKENQVNQIVLILAARLISAVSEVDNPEMTVSMFRLNKLVTDNHIIKTQAEIIMELCQKVDNLKSEKEEALVGLRKAEIELGWLRSPYYKPIGVK